MKTMGLAFLMLALLFAPRATGREDETQSARGTDRALQARTSLDLDGARLADVLKTLEQLSGCRFTVTPRGPTGPITLNVQNVRLRTALDAICDGLGGTWNIDARSMPATVHIDIPETSPRRDDAISIDQPITLRLADADLRDVLRSCARLLGVRVDMTAGVCGTVTLDVRKSPLSKLLDEACRQTHCSWRLDSSANESVLRVVASPEN